MRFAHGLLRIVVTLAVGSAMALVATVSSTSSAQAAATPTLRYVASASGWGKGTAVTATIPRSVKVGDRLIAFATWGSKTALRAAPKGWTALKGRNGNGIRGRAWTRTATAADAGRQLKVRVAKPAKTVLSVVAYRGIGGSAQVTASAAGGANAARKLHQTPAVKVRDANSWLVSVWSAKSAKKPTWKLGTSVTSRRTRTSGGPARVPGKISMVVGDSAKAVRTGTVNGRNAKTRAQVDRTVLYSVVVSPGKPVTPPVNTAPKAAFSFTCDGLTCGFDASASSDADGDQLTYSWDFGDSQTATGVSPSHTYANRGDRDVTLTVSDGTDSAQSSKQVSVVRTPQAGDQPTPGHTTMAPETASTRMPKINDGEIWDIEVVGTRAYVAGTFTSITSNDGQTTMSQAGLAAFDLQTGDIDTDFDPDFDGREVSAVEASPDGTKLYVAGTFNTINGVAKRKIALLDPATGDPVAGFRANANAEANALAASNTTVYVGGRFSTINNGGTNTVTRVGLAALDGTTGAVDLGFDNQLSGGIGTNGTLTVQQLKLTHDNSTLLVVHTARKIAGQDRYGIGLIDTATKQLLPWRTRLWEDNLQFVGGIQRIYGGDIAPDDSYFVVSSGSGGDRPPINDTAVAFSLDNLGQATDAQPLWVSRAFDSIYSVAIAEDAVYIGGHFQWNESPTAPDPWPGLDDVGYGTGQGLSAYSLGDAVVRRDHLGALDPETGKALEWHPGSNSFEGNKAMIATPQGVLAGGDAGRQGGVATGRVAFFDFNDLSSTPTDTTITEPIQGRVEPAGQQFLITGDAKSSVQLNRVQVTIRSGSNTLQTFDADLGQFTGGHTDWSIPTTIDGTRDGLVVEARAFASDGTNDPAPATKKIETFQFDDLPPTTSISSPSGSLQTSTSFVLKGTAKDDKGVNGVSIYLRDDDDRYLTRDGQLSDSYTTFRVDPDVIGATNATWQWEVDLPHEGHWKVGAMAVDTAGQSDTRWETREYTVDSSGKPPTVTISQPVGVTPPTSSPALSMAPGGPITFRGTATDDKGLANVEVSLRNSTTRQNLAADGSWGTDVIAGSHQISPPNLNATTYNWSYTMPADLVPGVYTFSVRATDKQDLTTSSSMQGRLTINVAVPGDAPPDGLLDFTGTDLSIEALHLDLSGSATDDIGVHEVRVALQDKDTNRYVQPDGTMKAAFATLSANLATPDGTATTWTLPVDLPTAGDFSVTAYAVDTSGQIDTSTTGATARYGVYPGDADPTLLPNLASPTEGTAFTESRIMVSGRAEDDQAMAEVDVAIVNSAGQYMSGSGTFSSAERWIAAFLNSPGSVGSNYSYTTPAIPAGNYQVLVRPIDNHGQYPAPRQVGVSVAAPAGNTAPVANASVSCAANVCTFDGRGTTDENQSTLAYAWSFGNGRTATGAVPTTTYTSAGTFVVTLTVTDEYGATGTTTTPVTITEPAGNQAPTAVITPATCVGLTCNISGTTSNDPDVGDALTYVWDFGDGTPTSTSSAPSHVYATPGDYTVSLTVTDGWGNVSATVTRTVQVSAP